MIFRSPGVDRTAIDNVRVSCMVVVWFCSRLRCDGVYWNINSLDLHLRGWNCTDSESMDVWNILFLVFGCFVSNTRMELLHLSPSGPRLRIIMDNEDLLPSVLMRRAAVSTTTPKSLL